MGAKHAKAFSLPLEAAALFLAQRPVEATSYSLVLSVSLYNCTGN